MLASRDPSPVGNSRPRNGPIARPAASSLPREAPSRQAPASGRAAPARQRRGLPAPNSGAENRPLPVRFRHSCAARRQPNLVRPNLVRQVAAANSEAALLPLGSMVRARRMQHGIRDMLIAREGEEIVCPKGTVCGRIMRDANDQIIDEDFAVREISFSPRDQGYVCACCSRPVAVREPVRWRVHLRRGWVR